MMISTCADAALVLGEDDYAEIAVDALEFVRDRLWDADSERLSRRFKDGDVKVQGYLEDYAFLAARLAVTRPPATSLISRSHSTSPA